jgi:sugar lactone lactonase YvrE
VSFIECVWPANAILGEAPFWSVDEGVLYWVDIDGKTVFRYRLENGAEQTFALERRPSSSRLPRMASLERASMMANAIAVADFGWPAQTGTRLSR